MLVQVLTTVILAIIHQTHQAPPIVSINSEYDVSNPPSSTDLSNRTYTIIPHKDPTINESFYYTVTADTPFNMYILNYKGVRIGSTSSSNKSFALSVKDSLRLYLSDFDASNHQFFTLQYNSGSHTISFGTPYSITNSGVVGQKVLDVVNTNYVVSAGERKITKIDLVSNAASQIVQYGVIIDVWGLLEVDSDTILIGLENTTLHLVGRSDHLVINNISIPQANILSYNINNLNNSEVYYSTGDNKLYRTTINSDTTLVSEIDISSKGMRNKIINLGTFNYLFFIPSENTTTVRGLLIDKTQFTISIDTLSFPSMMPNVMRNGMTLNFDKIRVGEEDRYYFPVQKKDPPYNLLSMYITIDPCTFRVGSICTHCSLNYYMTNQSTNNICVHIDDILDGNSTVVPSSGLNKTVVTSLHRYLRSGFL